MATVAKRPRLDSLEADSGAEFCGSSSSPDPMDEQPAPAATNTDDIVPIEGDDSLSSQESRFSRQSFSMPRYSLALLPETSTDADTVDRGALSLGQQIRILRYDPPWPVCEYHESSKRATRNRYRSIDHRDESSIEAAIDTEPLDVADEHCVPRRFAFLASRASKRYANVDEALSELNGWSAYPEVAIDGANGCGKSTLARSMNRAYLKINELLPRVTDGYGYNLSVFQSLEYLMFQQSIRANRVCWDRCRYSNLAFYYVHLLMHRFREHGVPNDRATVFEALNSFASSTNLPYTLSLLEREKPVPVLFLVCRDLELVALSLQRRGTAADLSHAKERDYQLAQYFVYCYFGTLLSYPVFDLSDLLSDTFTLGDLQQAIRDRVDVAEPVRNRDECLLEAPNTASADRLAAFLSRVDDVLLYDRSLK